jgi:hypothetical protein
MSAAFCGFVPLAGLSAVVAIVLPAVLAKVEVTFGDRRLS